MKVYWFYYKQIFLANLGISFVLSVIPLKMELADMMAVTPVFTVDSTIEGIKKLPFVFATVGFLIAVGMDTFFNKHTNYLYYNLGFSKRKVLVIAFLINIIVAVLLFPLQWI